MLPAWPAGVHALVSRGRSAAMAGSGRLLEQATYMDACVTLSSAVHGLLLFIQLLRSLCYQALIPGTTCLTLHLISSGKLATSGRARPRRHRKHVYLGEHGLLHA